MVFNPNIGLTQEEMSELTTQLAASKKLFERVELQWSIHKAGFDLDTVQVGELVSSQTHLNFLVLNKTTEEISLLEIKSKTPYTFSLEGFKKIICYNPKSETDIK